jgi:hypothetical protein
VLLRAVILGSGVLCVVAACGDDPVLVPATAKQTADYVEIDADSLCHLYTTDCPQKTGQTLDQCVAIYKAVRVSPACKEQLHALTCDNANSGVDQCWPTCSGQAPLCDGNHITECSPSGRLYTYDCSGVCATQNKTWSGTCGKKLKFETSNVDTCWCN